MTQTTIQPPPLHPGQREVWSSSARFRVLACGRRWGKTRLGVALCVRAAALRGHAWWVAPSFPMATVGWRQIKALARQIPGAEVGESERIVRLPGGGWVQVRSADNPNSLRGEGLDFVVVDECAFVQEAAWTDALRPALSDRRGGALFISTPKGRNWFWRLWQRGQRGGGGGGSGGGGGDADREWQSWRFPTISNPHIDPAEVEAARALLPERVFQQEYEAAFLDDAGGVFRRVVEAATATRQERGVPGHTYAVGVDWGKHDDFTVFSVMDFATRELVYLDRFNQIDYTVQRGRLEALCERFAVTAILAEQNAMGEPLIEQVAREGLPVRPFQTTNATKAAIIDSLALAFERGDIRILPDPVLIAELQAFEMRRLPSGLMRYEAPEGMHDDCVISLALAWSLVSVPPRRGRVWLV